MELMSYAIDFVSFLVQHLRTKTKIRAVILFGSVARDEADRKSDVDIFVDVLSDEKKIEKEIKKIRDKFFDSIKFKKYWALLNIKNDISIVVGKLDKWKLKDTMLGNAIVLYQKYVPRLEEGRNMVILAWESIKGVKGNSRRVMLNKKIFGYNYYGKFYKGVIEEYKGKKLGANVIMVPTEHLNSFVQLFHKFKVPVRIMRVFEYE